jgi:PAS domain S-box-containing protein
MLRETGRMAKLGGWELDLITMELTWTEETYRIHEVEPDQKPQLEDGINFYAPESRPVLQKALDLAINQGIPFDVELQFVTAKGNHLWVRSFGKADLVDGHAVRLFGVFQDITDRKQTEAALKNSEEKFREMANFLPQIIFETDLQGKLTYVNKHAYKIMRYDENDPVIGLSSLEFHIPDERARAIDNIQLKIENKPIERSDFMMLRKDGSTFPAKVYSDYYQVNGKPAGLRGLIVDISDIKKAEDSLKETNAYLENLINYANAPIIVWDPQFRITRFNHAFEKLTGRTEAEVLGKSLDILFPPELSGNSMALIHKTLMGERWETVEIKILHLNKSVKTLLWNSATLFMPDDKTPIATIAQGQDITERKQMEEQLIESSTRLVLAARAGHVGIWDYDIVNNVLEWDDQMFSLYGIAKSQFGGAYEAWLAGVHPDSKAQGDAEIQLALNGEKEFDTEFKVLWPDGSVHDIRALAIILRDNSGTPLRMIGTNWDITQQKKTEAEIKQRNEELHELNATKDKFFSIIAHDLKSPFSSILGFSELLKNEATYLDIDSIVQYAGMINSASQHAYELLENLLSWAVIQQGRMPFEPQNFILKNIVKAEFDELKGNADHKCIGLSDTIPENTILRADENMIRTILRNLISNAIKFTHKNGHVQVAVQTRPGHTIISVTDTGIGITPETIKKLFKIETSFTSRGTNNEKGTGLGLLLCKEFVEKHGGRIWVESEVGNGSTFSFTIPFLTTEQNEH